MAINDIIGNKLYICFYPTLSEALICENDFQWAKHLNQFIKNHLDVHILIDHIDVSIPELKTLLSYESNFIFLNPLESLANNESISTVHLKSIKDLNNFLDNLNNKGNFVNLVQLHYARFDICNQIDILKAPLLRKKNKIDQEISLLKNLSSQSEKRVKACKKFLHYFDSFRPITQIENTNVTHFEILNELYKLLLYAEVELNYAKYPEIDPVLGWLNVPKNFSSKEIISISNPFISLEFDSNSSGILTNIDYYPRKESISGFRPSFYFSKTKQKKYPTNSQNCLEPLLMRNSPDLFGIKFQEPVILDCPDSVCTLSKVFYLKSGLTPLANYSTTGFMLEFWIEDDRLTKNLDLTQETYLQIALSLNCKLDLVRFRYLSDMGGVSNETFSIPNADDKIEFSTKDALGGLKGIRVIDSINQFVSDYRFSRSIKNIIITNSRSNLSDYTYIDLLISLNARDIFGYEKSQNLTFSIF